MDFSPIAALMKEYGAPMTRDEYLKWNSLGKSKKVSAEEEAELPKRFAYPVVTHEELPPKKESKGAPADFGGPVFPNEDGVEPMLDTDTPASPTRLSAGAKLDKSLGGKPTMDISNPAKAQIEPDPMVPREQ